MEEFYLKNIRPKKKRCSVDFLDYVLNYINQFASSKTDMARNSIINLFAYSKYKTIEYRGWGPVRSVHNLRARDKFISDWVEYINTNELLESQRKIYKDIWSYDTKKAILKFNDLLMAMYGNDKKTISTMAYELVCPNLKDKLKKQSSH